MSTVGNANAGRAETFIVDGASKTISEIAANPQTVSALIGRVRELEAACSLALEELNRVPCAGLKSWRHAERACRHVLHGAPLMPGETLGPLPEVEG